MTRRLTANDVRAKKGGDKIVAVTATDYPTARWADRAGVDVILVGDSLGMTALGLSDTTKVKLSDMLHHTRAAARGVERALLVADLPFGEAAETPARAVRAAVRLVRDGGAQAVKVEVPEAVEGALRAIVGAGIPVMAHVGLTPQAIHLLGGYRPQGTTPEARARVLADADRALSEGAFSCVVEAVPSALGAEVTKRIPIPTIGIGAGPDCDGQILVTHDLLGAFEKFKPKFVRRYAEVGRIAVEALSKYAEDVRSGRFPSEEEAYE